MNDRRRHHQEGGPRCRRRVVGMLVTVAAVMTMMNGTAVAAFVVRILPPITVHNRPKLMVTPLGVSSRSLPHGHVDSDSSSSRRSPPSLDPNKATRRNKKPPRQPQPQQQQQPRQRQRHFGHDRKCFRFNQYLQTLVQEQKVEQAVQALQNAMSLFANSNSADSSSSTSSSSRVNTNDAAEKNVHHKKKHTTTQVLYNVVSFNTVLNGLATVGNAPAAQDLWDQFLSFSSSTHTNRSKNNNNHGPDIRSYNILIKAYCRYSNNGSNSNHHGVEQAQQILDEMMDHSSNTNDSIPSPDTTTYNTVLSTLLRIGRVKEADAILWRQWNHYLSSHPPDGDKSSLDRNHPSITTPPPPPPRPTTQMCNQLLHAWTKITMTTSNLGMIRDDKVNSLWALMQEYGPSHGFGADIVSYNTMLNAYVHNPPYVQEILDQMEQQNPQQQKQPPPQQQIDPNSNKNVPSPNAVSYSTVMKAWSRCTEDSEMDGAQKAANLLQRMRDRGVRPNVICYNTVIHAWASRGQWEKAEETLWQLLETCTHHGTNSNSNKGNHPTTEQHTTRMRPTEYSFAPLLHALSKSGRRDAGSKMEQWFDRMEQQWSVTPDRILYNACLYAWAKSGSPHAGVRANALLQHRIHRPDTHSYTSVLDAYSKSTALSNPSLAANQCDALLNQLELLDQDNHNKNNNDDTFILTSQLYNAAMNVFAKSGHAERAEAVMERMKTLSAQGNTTTRSNSTKFEPNIVTYATLLDAYTKSHLHDPIWTMERASQILQLVEDQYLASGGGTKQGVVHHLQPNSIFYSAVLQAWAKAGSKEGAERAEALLRRNQALYYSKDGRLRHDYARPNVLIFNAVMDAYARSGEPDVVRKVESLFKEMTEAEQIQPTRRSFTALLLAYRSENNTEKIEQLLERMRDLSRTTGDQNILPDTACYNYVLGAICDVASLTHDDAVVTRSIAERAQALVNQMEQEEESRWVKPDLTTYSFLVKAWTQVVSGDTELSRSTNAHNMTYTAVVKLLNQFDNDDDTQHLDSVTKNDLIRSIIESLKDRSDPAFTEIMKQLTEKVTTK